MGNETIKERLSSYPDISFIEDLSFPDLQQELILNYQKRYRELTGKDMVLAAADPVRLILYACAVTLYQAYQYEDRAAKMGLLKYSKGTYLDNLGALKGVKRNPARSATTVMRFTLSAALPFPVEIPGGTKTKAGNLYFHTTVPGKIPAGEQYTDIPSECDSVGMSGNGFLPGEINVLVNPLGYNVTVENMTETEGGADPEADEDFAERIYLAPASYSVAGPEAAYRYWVRSYNQSISDCRITSETPGEVDIYVILEGGKLPGNEFLQGLEKYLSQGDRRPLTDHVVVRPPAVVEYDIDVTYYLSKDQEDMAQTIQEQVQQACNTFIGWQKEVIGRDINPSKLTYFLLGAGAKRVDIRAPSFTAVSPVSLASVASITLIYGGVEDA